MIVLHYRAIPDLREQVHRATNPATDPTTATTTDPTTGRIEPEPLRTAEPEPASAELVRTARRLGTEAPPRPCRGLNGSRRREDAPSANRG